MYSDTYYVDKRTGTFADVLLAYGLATLLDSVLSQYVGDARWVRIRDAGPYYNVLLSHSLREGWVNAAKLQSLAPYIRSGSANSEDAKGAPPPLMVDYQLERTKFRQYNKTPQDAKAALPAEHLSQIKPHPHFQVFDWIAERRMQALGSYNELVSRWERLGAGFASTLRAILGLCAAPDVDIEMVEAGWRREMRAKGVSADSRATSVQLLNPSQGKGQNRAKANLLKMGNVDSFWPIEYLKAAGLFHCAVPRGVKGTGDRKAYALAPANIRLAVNDQILRELQDSLQGDTAVKMDVLAALGYTRCLLRWCEAGQSQDLLAELLGGGPENFVTGMYVAYYKNLGQASAVMNLSFIELPRWMRVRSPEDVKLYGRLIDEHQSVIRAINEDKGGYDLLVHYREFLSGRRWDDFFDFAAGYADYLMREVDRRHYWVRPFGSRNLEVLIVRGNEQFAPILQTPGFRNIAEAIRRSTITPQYMKRGDRPSEYEIRYGLGQDLRRKSLHSDEFIRALSEFVHSYNAENARVCEKTGKQFRKNILTSDLEDVVRLVDGYGAATIGNLLVAFGYAREPSEEGQE